MVRQWSVSDGSVSPDANAKFRRTKSCSAGAGNSAACATRTTNSRVAATTAERRKTFIRTLLDSVLISHMTTSPWRLPLAAALLLLGAPTAVRTQTPRPMGIVDLINIPRLGDPQLSPAGRDLLFTRADADWKSGRRIT